jgi:hypothetical protein
VGVGDEERAAPQWKQPVDDPVTLGEVKRSLDRLNADTTNRFDRLDRRIDQHHQSFVHVDVYRAEITAITQQLHAIEDSLRWTRRTLLAALIGGAVTMLIPLLVLATSVKGG